MTEANIPSWNKLRAGSGGISLRPDGRGGSKIERARGGAKIEVIGGDPDVGDHTVQIDERTSPEDGWIPTLKTPKILSSP